MVTNQTATREERISYTPGPWDADAVMSDRPHDIVLGYQIEGAGHPLLIASVYADEKQERRQPGYISAEQADANARLIAAAPDLLELAKRLAEECAECRGKGFVFGDDGITGFGPDDREPTREDCADCADIREVIAKAVRS
jgi:hypothetical protein